MRLGSHLEDPVGRRRTTVENRPKVASACHIDDVLIGANAVEAGHFERRKLSAGDMETPTRMREPNHFALGFGPAQNGQIQRGPVLDALGPWIILLLQIQQNDVARVA